MRAPVVGAIVLCGCGAAPSTEQISALSCARGDLNCDGEVNALDLQLMVNVILGTQTDAAIVARADLNGDVVRNALDLQALDNLILGVGSGAYRWAKRIGDKYDEVGT